MKDINESTSSLMTDTNIKMSEDINIKESKEILILIFKFISFALLILIFFFQFEFLLLYILKLIADNNTFILYTLFIFFHFALLRYIVQSILFILETPLLKSLCFYSIACNQLKELFEASKEFVNLYKNLKNKKTNKNEILLIDEFANIINIYMTFFKEIKMNDKLSEEQNELYENLSSWMNNYNEYKKKNNLYLNISNLENNNIIEDQKTFVYYLRKMHNDSNEIIRILSNFICENYQIFSIKKLYNCFFNNKFSYLSQYSFLFNQKFNNKFKSFVTNDNKIIDYTIITYNKLNKKYKNKNIIKDELENNKNLLIFCNPNGMIYQLFSPEKFLFVLEGGCDVLLWNYRGYGYSTGYVNFQNAKTDIIELFDFIKKKSKYLKYGAFGYSVGGGSATYLCQNRKLDVLICDRNYANINKIIRDISFIGEFLYYLEKLLFFKYEYNVTEFMNSKNKNIYKIVLCDPDDDIIPNTASLKSGISEYIIKKYCLENNLKKTDNILELFLDIENNTSQNKCFIESLLYIMDIWIQYIQNPFGELINKKNKSNKNEENVDKTLLLNINDNNDLNKKKFKRRLINTIIRFFRYFNYSSENLETLKDIYSKRLKILHIINYFNNFFIWGTISYKERNIVDGFLNPFNVKNNIYYIDNAIICLNNFLDDKFIKSMLGNNDNKESYNKLKLIRNCLIILKNKNDFINSIKNIYIGALIRLNCGHNGLYSEIDEKNLIDILKDVDFIKYNSLK